VTRGLPFHRECFYVTGTLLSSNGTSNAAKIPTMSPKKRELMKGNKRIKDKRLKDNKIHIRRK